jgi:Xaa-Pro aminopeptidase
MSTPLDFCKKRYSHLKQLMVENELDIVWLNISAGMGSRLKRIADTTSGTALIVPIDGDPALFVYNVDYISTVKESWIPVKRIESRVTTGIQVSEYANQFLNQESKVGVNLESLTYSSYEYYNKEIKGELTDITNNIIPSVFFGLYPGEIKYQRRVSQLADIGCNAAREAMSQGIKETDIAAEANYAMQKNDAETLSFQTIVSTGPRSSYSHGWPTSRKLKKGDFMLVDLGPTIAGYAADETRTFILGEDPKKQKMLHAMDEAVQTVIDNIKPGVICKELDAVSRKVLKKHGYPDYPHSLGHPLSGFPTPLLSKASETVLEPGMIFTVEPGIYIPEYGGVRMEENVVITEDGCDQLTKSPRII